MTAPDPEKRRRRRRTRHSPDAPLELTGTVPDVTLRPPRTRALAAPLAALVDALPAFTPDRPGRVRANLIRAVIGAAAILIVMASRGDLALGLVAVTVAATILVIPLPDHRKRRWARAARALATPREHPLTRPATARWDGARLEIRAAERVWKSLRPRTPPAAVVLAEDGPDLVLGLVHPHRPGGGLWFRGPRAGLSDPFDPIPPGIAHGRLEPVGARGAMRVDGAALAALLEAFWDPAEDGLPRPVGPASGTARRPPPPPAKR